MQLSTTARRARHLALASATVALTLAAAGCSDNNNTGPATPRMFNQVDRKSVV